MVLRGPVLLYPHSHGRSRGHASVSPDIDVKGQIDDINMPSNINDIELSDFRRCSLKELIEPTTVSQCAITLFDLVCLAETPYSMLAMRRLSRILHDYNATVFNAQSLHRKLAAILKVDARLVRVLDFCPALSDPTYSRDSRRLENQFDFLPWARFTWEWKIASYRMKFYSTFLGVGVADPALLESEQVREMCKSCEPAAKLDITDLPLLRTGVTSI